MERNQVEKHKSRWSHSSVVVLSENLRIQSHDGREALQEAAAGGPTTWHSLRNPTVQVPITLGQMMYVASTLLRTLSTSFFLLCGYNTIRYKC